jgi:hypothetical protein
LPTNIRTLRAPFEQLSENAGPITSRNIHRLSNTIMVDASLEQAYFEQARQESEDERFSSFCRDIAIIGDALEVPIQLPLVDDALKMTPCRSPSSAMITVDAVFTGERLTLNDTETQYSIDNFHTKRPSNNSTHPKVTSHSSDCVVFMTMPQHVLSFIGFEYFEPLSWLCLSAVNKYFRATFDAPALWKRAQMKYCPTMNVAKLASHETLKWGCLRSMNLPKWMSEVVSEHLASKKHQDAQRKFLCFADSNGQQEQTDGGDPPSNMHQQIVDLNTCSYGRPFISHGDGWKYFEGVRVGKSFFIVKALYRDSTAELSIDLYHTGTSGIARLSANALKERDPWRAAAAIQK